ncbi:Flp family type IVb pilin [Pelagibacterium limicola]|uniref:Flp family type IVb pilin n=1 Tax=Pelagibacterium limicola TaxID=2791022 RepID=UPI0018AF7420|nr:Flp family type IVb pilin [Pelagibacterium limicola]
MFGRAVKRMLADESGATAIEYGLIAALLSIIVLAAVSLINTPVGGLFGRIPEYFSNISFG